MNLPRLRLVALAAAVVIAGPASAAPAGSGARFREPVEWRGLVFPLMRTNWYSVINFANDWHAPRMRLVDGRWRQVGVHEGTDLFAEPGTPVLAVAPGRVENVGWTFYSGWRVGVRDEDGRYWFYAHLRSFAHGIAPGVGVDAGTVLGEVGNTGYGDEPGHRNEFTWHLHLGIQQADGTWVNPYPTVRRLYAAAVERSR